MAKKDDSKMSSINVENQVLQYWSVYYEAQHNTKLLVCEASAIVVHTR